MFVIFQISNNVGSGKKAIYADGGIHAREWLAVSTVLYMIDQVTFSKHLWVFVGMAICSLFLGNGDISTTMGLFFFLSRIVNCTLVELIPLVKDATTYIPIKRTIHFSTIVAIIT